MLAATLVAVGLVYARLIHAPFLTWDDDRNITLNPLVTGAQFGRAWLAPWFGLYVPVTTTLWTALWSLGAGATPFRLFNLFAHVANTALVWVLIARILEARTTTADSLDSEGVSPRLAATFGAAIFALHPLQAAAVGWISGGRDLAAAFLALLALIVVLRRTLMAGAAATLLFALAMLAKPSAASLPLAMTAFVAMHDRAHARRMAPLTLAWTGIAMGIAFATSRIQSEMTAIDVPFALRPFVAADAMGFYLLKVVAPFGLGADHGRTPAALAANPSIAWATVAALAVAVVATISLARRNRAAAAWAIAFAALQAPVLGFIPFAYQRISTVADHYAYFPLIAVGGLAATLATKVKRRALIVTAWAALVVFGAALSWDRAGVWSSDADLYADMLSANPTSFSALTNLGRDACESGNLVRGTALVSRAADVNPANPATLSTQAFCLFQAGALDQVIALRERLGSPEVQFALDHDDAAAASLVNTIAGAYFRKGDLAEGWSNLCQALAVEPGDASLIANARDLAGVVADRGIDPKCPSRRSWASLARRSMGP